MNDSYDTPSGPPPLPPHRRTGSRDTESPSHPLWPAGGGGFRVFLPIIIVALLLILPIFIWFFCRIEPSGNRVAILIHKTGETLPSGQIIALTEKQKGIQLKVLTPGRYFKNPYTWGWLYAPVTDVPAGKMGVVTRLFGKALPAGHIVAAPDEKGVVPEILSPGKYFINTMAYSVELADAVQIRPGHVGVVTALTGEDPLWSELPADHRNTFTVVDGEKGVLTRLLDPGTHYLNPYIYNISEVSLQSQRFEMSGEDAISFLTLDGFTVHVEGTLEFSIKRDSAALLTHRVGDMEDIVKKVILPRARGFSRIEGSKNKATSYIVGETRQQFQNILEAHLREKCGDWGVDIKSVLIRNIQPPDQIASVIRDREVAVQDSRKFEQQTEQARSKAELTKQEMLALQNKVKVDADTQLIRAVILAQQEQAVRLTRAQRELDVAKLENDAATFRARAILSEAGAQGAVIRFDNESQAAVIKSQVQAFGTGLQFARFAFYRELSPRMETWMATDAPDSFGALLKMLMTPVPQAQNGGKS